MPPDADDILPSASVPKVALEVWGPRARLHWRHRRPGDPAQASIWGGLEGGREEASILARLIGSQLPVEETEEPVC